MPGRADKAEPGQAASCVSRRKKIDGIDSPNLPQGVSPLQRFLDHMIDSPCTGVCKMDRQKGLCEGCYRTMEEISGWPYMNREQKMQVHSDAAARKKQREQTE